MGVQIINNPCKFLFNERRLMLKSIYNTKTNTLHFITGFQIVLLLMHFCQNDITKI